jgi:hypothetical protein
MGGKVVDWLPSLIVYAKTIQNLFLDGWHVLYAEKGHIYYAGFVITFVILFFFGHNGLLLFALDHASASTLSDTCMQTIGSGSYSSVDTPTAIAGGSATLLIIVLLLINIRARTIEHAIQRKVMAA